MGVIQIIKSNRSDIWVKQHPRIMEDGIYVPCQEYVQEGCESDYYLVISKEMFIEAYNKWIKGVDGDESK